MATKQIGSVFTYDPSKLGPTMRAAHEAYTNVYSLIPVEKRLAFEQMDRAFAAASMAYQVLFKFDGDMRTDCQRICEVGGYANMFLIHFNNLRQILQGGDDKVLETMDKTSDWYKSKDWPGLPIPINENGVRVIKTAKGVHNDMKQFYSAYEKLCAEINMKYQMAGIQRGRK